MADLQEDHVLKVRDHLVALHVDSHQHEYGLIAAHGLEADVLDAPDLLAR